MIPSASPAHPSQPGSQWRGDGCGHLCGLPLPAGRPHSAARLGMALKPRDKGWRMETDWQEEPQAEGEKGPYRGKESLTNGTGDNRVGTRRGDSELLWGPRISPTPSWAVVSTWLVLATKGSDGLGQGKAVHPAVGTEAKAQNEEEKQEGREERDRGGEGDTESRRQKGREKKRPKTERNPEGQL